MADGIKLYASKDDINSLVKSVIISGKQITVIKNDDTSTTTTLSGEDVFTGASSSAAGSTGLVPAPAMGDQNKYLRADGTWGDVAVTVDSALSSTSENPVQNKVIASAMNEKLSLTGGTMNGALVAQSSTDYSTYQVRNIAYSTSAATPTGNGNILAVYS